MNSTTNREATTATVLGVGALGAAVARALLEHRVPVSVWNRTSSRVRPLVERGAVPAASPLEAIAASDVTIVTVATYDDVAALLRPLAGRLRGRTVVVLTSADSSATGEFATWAGAVGLHYVAGAAMSGTTLVGRPDAYFLYAGEPQVVNTVRSILDVLGRVDYVGRDVALVPILDGALLGINVGLLVGFYHAAALTASAGTRAADLARTARSYLPFALDLMERHAAEIDEDVVSNEDGTLAVYVQALQHLVQTAHEVDVVPVVPQALLEVVQHGVTTGHADEGLAGLVRALRQAPV